MFKQINLLKQFKATLNKQKPLFHTKSIENYHIVSPPLPVPQHIPRPSFLTEQNPIYGQYEGEAAHHNEEMMQKMRKAGKLAAKTVEYAASLVKEGVTLDYIDKKVHEFICDHNAYPTPLGFMKFPKSICLSVNDVVAHGIPNSRELKQGDSLNLDVCLFLDGVHGDNSMMAYVPPVHEDIIKLINVTQKSMYEAIKVCGPGKPFKKIADVIYEEATKNNLEVCDVFTGHGIGHLLHLPPMIHHKPNKIDRQFNNEKMKPGHVFTIEPILLLFKPKYEMWNDDFTVVSYGNPSAQWEHTIAITQDGYEVLTIRENEEI